MDEAGLSTDSASSMENEMREKKKTRWVILAIAPIANYLSLYVYYSWGIIPALLLELLIGIVLVVLFLEELVADWNTFFDKTKWIGIFIPISVVVTKTAFILLSKITITEPSGILIPITDYSYMHILLVGPLIEELSCRFLIFRVIKNPWLALIVSSVYFGLLHVIIQVLVTQDVMNLLPGIGYAVMGAVFGLSYRRTKNIWAPIAVHAAYNLIILLI